MIVISADTILLNFTQQEPDNISAINRNRPVINRPAQKDTKRLPNLFNY